MHSFYVLEDTTDQKIGKALRKRNVSDNLNLPEKNASVQEGQTTADNTQMEEGKIKTNNVRCSI